MKKPIERCPHCGKREEAWAAVNEKGLYEVSDIGRVRSWNLPGGERGGGFRRDEPLVMIPSGRVAGCYPALRICGKTRTVHSLVLEGFSGVRPAGLVARHLDCNPLHNCCNNLCYGTCKENVDDTARLGRSNKPRGERHPRHKLTDKTVLAARNAYRQGRSVSGIANRFAVSKTAMECALIGRTWSHVANPVRLRRPAIWASWIVEAVCRRWASGEPLSDVARCYSVPYRTVYGWTRERSPKHRKENF